MKGSGNSSKPSNERLTDSQVAAAAAKIREGFLLSGLTEAGSPVCPVHKKVHANALVIKRDSWFCYSAKEGGNAIHLLTKYAEKTMPFPVAVRTLLGLPQRDGSVTKIPDEPLNLDMKGSSSGKTSTVDSEVYDALLKEALADGGLSVAVNHYGRWHISPEAVKRARVVGLAHPARVHASMLKKFGRERLLKAGLIKESITGRVSWMVNKQYPIIEPHIMPDGRVVGLQFRASVDQEKKIAAHKKWTQDVEAGKASEEDKVPYVPKFLSLSGIVPEKSLVGGGLHVAAQLPAGSQVLIVEGIKDMMAAWTLGHNAVGIPGTSARFAPAMLETLRPLKKVIALDGDEAGQEAVKVVGQYLTEDKQSNVSKTVLPAGQDITDVLVSRSS